MSKSRRYYPKKTRYMVLCSVCKSIQVMGKKCSICGCKVQRWRKPKEEETDEANQSIDGTDSDICN